MIKVSFNKLRIKNFLSIGNDPVEIKFRVGLNIITGNNRDKEDRRNGVGKSAIADALNFAIFGTPLRPIKNESISNDSTSGKCEVSLEFTVESPNNTKRYKIVRCLSPSKVHLYIDDVDKTLDSIKNNNEFICKVLNCNQEVFDNCVIMTLNNTLPFMGREKQDKRKFIESILNLEVFSKMLTQVKTEYAQGKKDFDVISGKLTEITSTLNAIKTQQISFNERKTIKIASLQVKINELNAVRENLNKSYEKLKDIDFAAKEAEVREQIKLSIESKEAEDKKISRLISQEATCSANILNLERNIQKIAANIGQCPVCLRDINEHDKSHIDSEKKKIEDEIKTLKAQKNELIINKKLCLDEKSKHDVIINEKNTKVVGIVKLQQQFNETKNQLGVNKTSIEQYQSQVRDTEKETASYDTIITDQEAKIKDNNDKLITVKSDIQLLDQVKFVLSEEGVKSFLVKRILDVLNDGLSYYLTKLDANCSCAFSEYFEELIVNDKGKSCSYYNFSGAERKNIDLACLFAFMDIRRLQGDVSFNISIYDELLDSSLDEKGIELVIDILKERIETYGESVFVISHRKESAKFATGEIIMLEKFNGVTRRVDFVKDEN